MPGQDCQRGQRCSSDDMTRLRQAAPNLVSNPTAAIVEAEWSEKKPWLIMRDA